jgi:hypothetical protein
VRDQTSFRLRDLFRSLFLLFRSLEGRQRRQHGPLLVLIGGAPWEGADSETRQGVIDCADFDVVRTRRWIVDWSRLTTRQGPSDADRQRDHANEDADV